MIRLKVRKIVPYFSRRGKTKCKKISKCPPFGSSRAFPCVPKALTFFGRGNIILRMHTTVKKGLGIQLTLHIDPIDNEDEETLALKERCMKVVRGFGEGFSLHDFRLVKGMEHTNILFDVEVPFEHKVALSDVEKKLEEEFAGEEMKYYFVLSRDIE